MFKILLLRYTVLEKQKIKDTKNKELYVSFNTCSILFLSLLGKDYKK